MQGKIKSFNSSCSCSFSWNIWWCNWCSQVVSHTAGVCWGCCCFFRPSLILSLPPHLPVLRICVTCQQKPATEKQLRCFFFSLRASSPLRQAAPLRLRSTWLLAAAALPRDICQGQWQQERLESILSKVSQMKGRQGLRRPSLISCTSAGFSTSKGKRLNSAPTLKSSTVQHRVIIDVPIESRWKLLLRHPLPPPTHFTMLELKKRQCSIRAT